MAYVFEENTLQIRGNVIWILLVDEFVKAIADVCTKVEEHRPRISTFLERIYGTL